MAANGIMRWGLELLGGNVAAMLLFHPVAFTLVGTTVYQHYSADGVDPEGSDILLEDAVVIGTNNGEDFDVTSIPEETSDHSPPPMLESAIYEGVRHGIEGENEPPDINLPLLDSDFETKRASASSGGGSGTGLDSMTSDAAIDGVLGASTEKEIVVESPIEDQVVENPIEDEASSEDVLEDVGD